MTTSSHVLIVGAGPVGLTLAIDLAQRGIDVALVELRPRGARPEPKCNHVAARTMETFRRLGLVEAVRNAGLPADYANDVSYRTTFAGQELTRIPIPCRRDRYSDTSGPDGWWPTPEPPHRINQTYLEPILAAHAESLKRIRFLHHHEVVGVAQCDRGVRAEVRHGATGDVQIVEAQYLIGCDGGRSLVRKAIGANFVGDAVIQRVQSSFIDAPDLITRQQHKSAWATFSLNPRRSGNVYAIDGKRLWLVHNYLRPNETDFDSVDRDRCIRTILGVDDAFAYQLISKEDWFGRRLVSDRFRDRRMFIAGDAAHIWVPYAGYGMNAGIADAMTLSWQLAAHLQGFAPAKILDAYEAERLPLTTQVSRFAMDHAEKEIKNRGAVPADIEDDTQAGHDARRRVGEATYALNVQQYCCAGLNFGYYYDRSPIIAYDGEAPPDYTMATFTASTVPGCRAPHLWMDDGTSLYDHFGPCYTLLRRNRDIDPSSLLAAARHRGVPLKVVDLPGRPEAIIYSHDLTIVRPDQHVAWRGRLPTQDSGAVIDRLRGAL